LLTIEPTGKILGATVHNLDLTVPLSSKETGTLLWAIGKYGLLRFPNQHLAPRHMLAFARNFGTTQIVKGGHIPEHPEMSVLSNIIKDGKPFGVPDAGIIWHKDMTYQDVPGFANFLYAITVPQRDGAPLGDTQFLDSQSAYDDLPEGIKARLEGAIGVHTGRHYVQAIREAFPDQAAGHEKRHSGPEKRHSLVLTHPITGHKLLYLDAGHVEYIEGAEDAVELLRYLNQHQLQDKYLYRYQWTEGDVVMWDNLRSLHRGSFDYGDEPRLIQRCQVLSDRIFDPSWVRATLVAGQDAAMSTVRN
jgi:taurine dioxygenase